MVRSLIYSPSSSMLHHQPYELNYPHPQQQQQLQNYGYSNNDKQHINTLFVSGLLPDDVKAREIHNLFRRRHGFDSCQLKYTGRGNQVVAFATFFNHHSAMAAMNELNDTMGIMSFSLKIKEKKVLKGVFFVNKTQECLMGLEDFQHVVSDGKRCYSFHRCDSGEYHKSPAQMWIP